MTPQNKKKLIYTGVGLLAVSVIYMVFFRNSSTSPGSGSNEFPAFDFNAKEVANDLFLTMRELGTEEADIVSILKQVDESQFAKVFSAFGKKPYNKTTGNQYEVIGFPLKVYDLKVWLYEELSDADYKILKYKYPKYL